MINLKPKFEASKVANTMQSNGFDIKSIPFRNVEAEGDFLNK
jgi:hypothetical protein